MVEEYVYYTSSLFRIQPLHRKEQVQTRDELVMSFLLHFSEQYAHEIQPQELGIPSRIFFVQRYRAHRV
jgi:hypothetical protein